MGIVHTCTFADLGDNAVQKQSEVVARIIANEGSTDVAGSSRQLATEPGRNAGNQGELPTAPSTAKVWYFAYFSPTRRTCTYSGSFRQAFRASILGYM